MTDVATVTAPKPAIVPAGHGCFSYAEVREVVEDAISAIQNLVMPGMAEVL